MIHFSNPSCLGILTLLSSGFSTASPLSLSLRCSDSSFCSIPVYKSFSGLGSRLSFLCQLSSIYRWPLISYWLQDKVHMAQNELACPSHPSPTLPDKLIFCSSWYHHSGPVGLFLVSQYAIHVMTPNVCSWDSIFQEILPILYLVSESASLYKVQLLSPHLQETVSSSSTFQWPLPFPRQSLGHLSEIFTMALNHIPFYNLTWLPCFSELTVNFCREKSF